MPAIKMRVSVIGGARTDTKVDVSTGSLKERRFVLKNGVEISTTQVQQCIEEALNKLVNGEAKL